MAAPTAVFAEANSLTTTSLYWDYAGANIVSVYRSPDGITYTFVALVAVGTKTYADTGRAAGTKYWYKLSDDDGVSFSSVVTVITHSCVSDAGGNQVFALPRFTGDQQQADDLNNMAQRIEDTLGDRTLAPDQCVACPVDGALILDCSEGCHDWVVVADQNINSISMQWCGEAPTTIEFLVAPNTTRSIGGWPAGFGFSGGETKFAKFVTGAAGGAVKVKSDGGKAGADGGSRPSYNSGGSGGGGGGGGIGGDGCTCTPRSLGAGDGGLTIKSCNANNSLNCASTKSLTLKVCGGKGPYTWSRTGTVAIKGSNQTAGSTATGTSITVTPPANTGSAEIGSAYQRCFYGFGGSSLGVCVCAINGCIAGCADQHLSLTSGPIGCGANPPVLYDDASTPCAGSGFTLCTPAGDCSAVCSPVVTPGAIEPCTTVTGGVVNDLRTVGMIAAGCVPCGLSSGNTVSVTDALGVTVVLVLAS